MSISLDDAYNVFKVTYLGAGRDIAHHWICGDKVEIQLPEIEPCVYDGSKTREMILKAHPREKCDGYHKLLELQATEGLEEWLIEAEYRLHRGEEGWPSD